jgi:hypothetical protein
VSFIFQSLVNPGNEGGKREINRTRRLWSQTRRKYPKIKSIKKKEKGGKKAVLLLHQPNVRCFSGGESGEERASQISSRQIVKFFFTYRKKEKEQQT